MKPLLTFFLVLFLALPLMAQHEEDFAAHFVELNGGEADLECTTVSPRMMERILMLPTDTTDSDTLRPLLEQVKSVRIITCTTTPETAALLYEKAEVLAQFHPLEYQKYAHDSDCTIYTRRRGAFIVELVLIMQTSGTFNLVDLTGNMTEEMLKIGKPKGNGAAD